MSTTKSKTIKLSSIKPNPDNPRLIKDDKFYKLVESIKTFGEKMMPLRPIVIDENKIILGGNMRFKALKELGYKEVPASWVKSTNELSEEEKKEFIIKDNVGFGDWDFDSLAYDWDINKLEQWGLDINIDVSGEIEKEKEIKGEIEFSEVLMESNNYVVLFFDNEIDWLQAQTHFELKTVNSKRSNGEAWSSGVGRVLNGADYLKKVTE